MSAVNIHEIARRAVNVHRVLAARDAFVDALRHLDTEDLVSIAETIDSEPASDWVNTWNRDGRTYDAIDDLLRRELGVSRAHDKRNAEATARILSAINTTRTT